MATEAIGAPANAGALVPHTSIPLRRAVPQARPARILIDGPSGSGRTWTALDLATGLAGDGGRIAVIDTNGGASLRYAGHFDFVVLEMEVFTPENLLTALYETGSHGCDVLVIDDYSPFWSGPGGLLELVDSATAVANQAAAKAKQPLPGSSAGWTAVRPRERAALDALAAFPGHVVATVTALPETVLETTSSGRTVPRRHGLRLDQRAGVDSQFDIGLSLLPGGEHHAIVTKSHLRELDGRTLEFLTEPARSAGARIDRWARDGVDCWPKAEFYTQAYDPAATVADLERLLGRLDDARARRMTAFNDAPRRAANEHHGSPIALGVLVARRLEILRQNEERARRSAPPAPRRHNPAPVPAPAPSRPAAPQRQAPAATAPGPDTGTVPPPARPKADDRPASLPVDIDTGGEEDTTELAKAAVVRLIRADGAWDSSVKLAGAFSEASIKRLLDEPVHCEDGRWVPLRSILTTRQAELKELARAVLGTSVEAATEFAQISA